MTVRPIPEGYHTVTPYLYIRGAARALDFYRSAFSAVELMRFPGPGGKLMHAEIKIGDSVIMLADENPQMGARSPESYGGSASSLCIYADNVDALFGQAVAAGAKVVRPVSNQFYGDRSGTVQDPFGHQWTISTHTEDVAPDEMMRRFEEHMRSMPPPPPPAAPKKPAPKPAKPPAKKQPAAKAAKKPAKKKRR